MNKKTLLTAVALGAAVVYAVRKLRSRAGTRQSNETPTLGTTNSRHHLTDVFSRAKPQPMEQI